MQWILYISVLSVATCQFMTTSSIYESINLLNMPYGLNLIKIDEDFKLISSPYSYIFNESKPIELPLSELELSDSIFLAPFVLNISFTLNETKSGCLFSILDDGITKFSVMASPASDNLIKIEIKGEDMAGGGATTLVEADIKEPTNVLVEFREPEKETEEVIETDLEETEIADEESDAPEETNSNCPVMLTVDVKEAITFSSEAKLFLGHCGTGNGFFKGAVHEIKVIPSSSAESLCTSSPDDEEFDSTFSSKGEKGDKGEPGASLIGPQGPQGPEGPPGSPGVPGRKGDTGSCQCSESVVSSLLKTMPEMHGPPGERGPRGDMGDRGLPGMTGKQGEQGERGPLGFKGDRGERGEAGPSGKDGIPGTKGEAGKDGEPGPQGVIGPMGPPGPPGPGYKGTEETKVVVPGEKGDLGPIGPPGPQGHKGSQGERGEKGDFGAKGERGERGEPGPEGPRGEKGEHGKSGLDGMPGIPGTHGRHGHKGDKGDKGDQGIQGMPGEAAKLTSLLDPEMDPYEKAEIVKLLKGDKGNTGVNGDKGEKGDTGATGPQGPPGTDGRHGIHGREGPQGPKGDMGPQGNKGDAGEPGLPGNVPTEELHLLKGPRGETGLPGPVGPQGQKGQRGPQGPRGWTGKQGEKGDGVTKEEIAKLKGEKGDRGGIGPQGDPGSIGPPGKPCNDSKPVPGPPGPPGTPGERGPPGLAGRPGTSVMGPKGEPGGVHKIVYSKDIELDGDFFTAGTVVCQNMTTLIRKTAVTPYGTIAYVLLEKILVIRVEGGWQNIKMGSLISAMESDHVSYPVTPDPYITTHTEGPHTTSYHTVNTRSSQGIVKPGPPFIRLVALNLPYTGNINSTMGRVAGSNLCHVQSRVRFHGNFVPFLDYDVENLQNKVANKDRNLPVVNLHGEKLFDSWNSIFSEDYNGEPPIYSFEGRNVLFDGTWPVKAVWHGGDSNGRRSDVWCEQWRSNSPSLAGNAWLLTKRKLSEPQKFPCNSNLIVLCVEKTAKNMRRTRHSIRKNNQGTRVIHKNAL